MHGKNQDVLKDFPSNFFDSVITDPPYELGFMSKAWDASGVAYNVTMWEEVLRVAKPGATLFCFGGTRTYHRVACAIEDAGWQLKDSLMWIYGSGFPKSMDISKALDKEAGAKREIYAIQERKPRITAGVTFAQADKAERFVYSHPATDIAKQWNGYGTALKPAFEPIILAMKPLEKGLTYAQNARKWGVAGLNIDAGRISTSDSLNGGGYDPNCNSKKQSSQATSYATKVIQSEFVQPSGRWPANVILSHSLDCVQVGTQQIKGNNRPNCKDGVYSHETIIGSWGYKPNKHTTIMHGDENGQETIDVYACVPDCPIRIMDAQSGNRPSCNSPSSAKPESKFRPGQGNYQPQGPTYPGDSGGASRFFYTAKASRSEREFGLKDFVPCAQCCEFGTEQHTADAKTNRPAGKCLRNNHPTTKPLAIMDYLCKLIKMPNQDKPQIVLDPFCGSGTTLLAAEANGMKYIGIDMILDHVMIATSRSIKHTFEEVVDTQMTAEEISGVAEQLSSDDFGDLLI